MKKLSFFLVMSCLISFSQLTIANKKYIEQFLPRNPVILEAGAHIGVDTVEMAKMWPTSTIHAFEPVPKLYNQLIASTYQLPNVRCYELALSNISGRATFYVSGGAGDASSSLLKPKEHLLYHPQISFDEVIEVKTLTLDEWALQNGVDHIDFMWLDMQGTEFNMLKAAPQILKTTKVIFIKIAFTETYKNIALYSEVRPWLESQGFMLIYEEVCGAAKAEGNALFIRATK